MHIMDIAQNSIRAGATEIGISIDADEARNEMSIVISDNGCGMSEDMVQRVISPFTTTRTTRRVGLGIPLFKDGCESTGGSFSIQSTLGVGTKVIACYVLDHLDRPPLGALGETLHSLIISNPDLDFAIRVRFNQDDFELNTKEVRETLGNEVSIDQPEVSAWLMEYLKEGLEELFGGVQI